MEIGIHSLYFYIFDISFKKDHRLLLFWPRLYIQLGARRRRRGFWIYERI